MTIDFTRTNATDTLQKGAVYRVTFERSQWLGWAAVTAQTLWTALEGSMFPVFRVSPMPANGPVAIIDLKARTDAPTQSVGAMVNAIDIVANWSVTRVELLGSEDMSTERAAAARTSLTVEREKERGFENPFNRIGDAIGAVKWIAVAAVVVAVVYVFVKYVPKPKGRR